MSDSETWRDQRERRFQLARDQALTVLERLAADLPIVSYWPGSTRTLVVTTYLDSPANDYLRMVEESRGRVSLKVRIREYIPLWDRPVAPGDPEFPTQSACYLERKERIGDIRQKHRVKLEKALVGAVLRREASVQADPEVAAALEGELALRALAPKLVSVYERRVFGDEGGALRITLDERLRFHAPPEGLYDSHAALTPEVLGQAMAPGPPRILEVKQPNLSATPRWLEGLLASLPDVTGYSKFRDGMNALGDENERPSLTRPLIALK